ncbi:MAG: hypothetical protein J6S62_05330 [Bacteroidales bacterium]|nr:hypothetical protein [Bacteroidales bacterium]
MNDKRHTYIRPQAENCLEGAYVGCAGNEPLQPGSPWHIQGEDDDLTVSEIWDF